jgi:hypothetical protein
MVAAEDDQLGGCFDAKLFSSRPAAPCLTAAGWLFRRKALKLCQPSVTRAQCS